MKFISKLFLFFTEMTHEFEKLRWTPIYCSPPKGYDPAEDNRRNCRYTESLECRLIDLHPSIVVKKNTIRKLYRDLPLDNLWAFGPYILIDHQHPKDGLYKRRIYTVFNDTLKTENIHTMNFIICQSAYDCALDYWGKTEADIHDAIIGHVMRNYLL